MGPQGRSGEILNVLGFQSIFRVSGALKGVPRVPEGLRGFEKSSRRSQRHVKMVPGGFWRVSIGLKGASRGFGGIPGGLRRFKVFPVVPGMFQRDSEAGDFEEFRGLLGDLRGVSRESQGVSGGTMRYQGRFRASQGCLKVSPGGSEYNQKFGLT